VPARDFSEIKPPAMPEDTAARCREVIMHHIRRFIFILAGLTATVVASAAAAPAALAIRVPPPDGALGHPVKHAPIIPARTQTIVVGGMPGWQITLIAAGTALTVAVLAVLLDRRLIARRRTTASAAACGIPSEALEEALVRTDSGQPPWSRHGCLPGSPTPCVTGSPGCPSRRGRPRLWRPCWDGASPSATCRRC
jgi:hypothetical protein